MILNGQTSLTTMGFYMKEKGDGCHEGLMFKIGGIQVKCIFNIQDFDLFGKIEETSNAHGMGVSCT